jgi:ribonuclease HI
VKSRIYVETLKNSNISDRQAANKALAKHQITSNLVWDCRQSLVQLGKHNRVQLIWVTGHEGIVGLVGNETADQLARTESEHSFIRPELACGISIGVAKKAARVWTNRNYKKTLKIHNWTHRQEK